jgi:hypothetical protein
VHLRAGGVGNGGCARSVACGMTSFTNFKSFWRGRGRGRSRGLSPLLFMFMRRVNISRAHAEVRVLWLQRLLVGNFVLCRGLNLQA